MFFSFLLCIFSYLNPLLLVYGLGHELPGLAYEQDLLPKSYVRVQTTTGIIKVELNEYLLGVLPNEMPAGWPIEALKAQAVAARSYVMWQKQQRAALPFDVDDTVLYQVYKPKVFLALSKTLQEKILKSVNETHGQYLVDSHGQAYSAYFHADCGGVTEQADQIWGANLNFHIKSIVRDQDCDLNKENYWKTLIKRQQFTSQILNYFKIKENVKLINVTVDSYTSSGRVSQLKMHFDVYSNGQSDGVHLLNAQTFRQIFGFSRVKSANFNLNWSDEGLLLTGRGRGHGAGLCQSGSRFMALAGKKYVEILNHYYSEVRLNVPMLFAKQR